MSGPVDRYVSPEGRRVRAVAELTQAATRYWRSGDCDVAREAAAERLGMAYTRALRAGLTFDEAYAVAGVTSDTAWRVERGRHRRLQTY